MKTLLTKRLARYFRRCDGSISVETALVMPILFALYAGAFVWFDAYRVQNINLKATYTISDMISREYEKIDSDYFDGLDKIYDYLTHSTHPTSLRVSTLECTGNCDSDEARTLEVCWSHGSTGRVNLTTADIKYYEHAIPLFHEADTLIMTETFLNYSPAFNVGINAQTFENTVFTRPRLAGQIKFEDSSGTLNDCYSN
ncbi:TadE-like protein [Aliiruegeria haliotis]|uniref:TadE-like protein n=1 Tax=Aliiruegeria haliotis TaxID=1280846 RepID=A0A2T0RVP7_9RHOB|nr:TadE/TadG family type IV pilus assembly protein [Aliiruegeria haliotis]PRY25265.1 TadE-like protein [Aliiruegeria haliotis]